MKKYTKTVIASTLVSILIGIGGIMFIRSTKVIEKPERAFYVVHGKGFEYPMELALPAHSTFNDAVLALRPTDGWTDIYMKSGKSFVKIKGTDEIRRDVEIKVE